ncbi:hypothetical protein LTR16_007800, partial [Cryomyces antarcticus]
MSKLRFARRVRGLCDSDDGSAMDRTLDDLLSQCKRNSDPLLSILRTWAMDAGGQGKHKMYEGAE